MGQDKVMEKFFDTAWLTASRSRGAPYDMVAPVSITFAVLGHPTTTITGQQIGQVADRLNESE